MVRRSLIGCPIGGLLLISGDLFLVNMRSFEKTWGAISTNVQVGAEPNRKARRAAATRGESSATNFDAGGLRVLGSLEQPVFMILRSGKDRLWSTLDPNFLSGGSADLNLKHGLTVAGEWHMLSILDCHPGSGVISATEMGRLSGGGDNTFSDSVISIWNEFRLVFGRPIDCYGVTPIVIMREIV
jgi:hypothetical protein